MAVDDHNLIWVDLEMTGLIPEQDRVIEIATIVTDHESNSTGRGPRYRHSSNARCFGSHG